MTILVVGATGATGQLLVEQLLNRGQNVKIKLSTLWVTLMLLYIYADIFSLYRPGLVEKIIAGEMGPFPVTQISLLTASIMMIIPAVMVMLSLILKSRAGRWTNIIAGILYSVISLGNLIGETWIYYIAFGIIEIVITLIIVWYSWNWPKQEVSNK